MPLNQKTRAAAVLAAIAAMIVFVLLIVWLRSTNPEGQLSIWLWRAMWYVALPVAVIAGIRAATRKNENRGPDG